MKKRSSRNALDPYLDASALLRVGGRIKKANLSHSLKNPVILPQTGHITELVLRHAHEKTHHSRRGLSLKEVRSNDYWIINGNAAVRHFISRCVTCGISWYFWRKENGQPPKFPCRARATVFILCGELLQSVVY